MNINELSENDLKNWLMDAAKLWLAHDGLWFQSVEKKRGIEEAIEHDKNAWTFFSPLEAKRIKGRLNLPDNSGLEGLKKALDHRLYAILNKQEIVEETDTSFVFRMNDCRVQSARKRKGLNDFPCKPVGIVEYSTFATEIDSRITTECICCPPDEHPEQYYCAWKFTLAID
ncbi:MAG: DUF6125 family protein [Planctomycetes bacterium]|nr:DUF6125 family protein [Planctomycetota bacterium]